MEARDVQHRHASRDRGQRMSKREFAIIIGLMVAGFIAWEVVSQFNGVDRDEIAPVEAPELTGGLEEVPVTDQMMAYVAAVRAAELHAAMGREHDLPDLPSEVGLLAVVGNPGEFFFTKQLEGRGEVWIMRAARPEILWSIETGQLLELVGAHGSELFLKFIDEPFGGPRDAWELGGFYGLDMFAPGGGIYPAHIDDETVALIRRDIR